LLKKATKRLKQRDEIFNYLFLKKGFLKEIVYFSDFIVVFYFWYF